MEVTLKSMPFRLDLRLKLLEVRKKTKLQHPTPNFSPGLTLVELLIVIAILGILASFTSFALLGHQKKARDAQRKNDMQVFKKTMELAKSDCRNQAYYPYIGTLSWANINYNYMITRLRDAGYQISDKKDPLNPDNVTPNPRIYGLAQESTPGPSAVCPQSAVSGLNLSGRTYFVAYAKLEISNDKDAAPSKANCTDTANKTGLQTASDWSNPGNYYVCSN